MEGANMKIEFYTSTEIENIEEVIEHIKKTNIIMYDVGTYRVINLNDSTFTILITSPKKNEISVLIDEYKHVKKDKTFF
jgi:hypothetical protein